MRLLARLLTGLLVMLLVMVMMRLLVRVHFLMVIVVSALLMGFLVGVMLLMVTFLVMALLNATVALLAVVAHFALPLILLLLLILFWRGSLILSGDHTHCSQHKQSTNNGCQNVSHDSKPPQSSYGRVRHEPSLKVALTGILYPVYAICAIGEEGDWYFFRLFAQERFSSSSPPRHSTGKLPELP